MNEKYILNTELINEHKNTIFVKVWNLNSTYHLAFTDSDFNSISNYIKSTNCRFEFQLWSSKNKYHIIHRHEVLLRDYLWLWATIPAYQNN